MPRVIYTCLTIMDTNNMYMYIILYYIILYYKSWIL